MALKNHRVVGIVRVEAPVLEFTPGDDDDSTLGGLLAGFAQRSLIADAACLSRLPPICLHRETRSAAADSGRLRADLTRLATELEAEFAALNEVHGVI